MFHRRFRTSAPRGRVPRALVAAVALGLAAASLSACEGDDAGIPEALGGAEETSDAPPAFRLRSNLPDGPVPVDHAVRLSAKHGSLRSVRVSSRLGELPGRVSKDGTSWSTAARLEPGLEYRVRAEGRDSEGNRVVRTSRFRTQALTLDQQTYASVAPLQGETVGVGMPVIVTFDVPVTNRASMEKHMTVTASPHQRGSWHWLSDQEVHWRPRHYWRAGSDVSVDLDINSVNAGGGIYGQENRHVEFNIGDAHVYRVNMDTDQMRVFNNGSLIRTIPITTGKPGFTTRSGVKVIIEKYRKKRMNAETIGIRKNDPEYYNIAKVEYAMRVTYSGEFVHAAPWSVGSQGVANVSHGCTGMSTANAAWLYGMSIRGDVVEYVGSDRPMTLTNGYGDWNLSFPDWASGSALS